MLNATSRFYCDSSENTINAVPAYCSLVGQGNKRRIDESSPKNVVATVKYLAVSRETDDICCGQDVR